MKNHKHEELMLENPQIEIEYDMLEAEKEYDDIGISDRLRNKLKNGAGR